MSLKEGIDPLAIYEELKLDLKLSGTELVGECPFCGSKKFYVNTKKTTFDCKVCGEHGNNITILGAMHEQVFKRGISDDNYHRLSTHRNLPEGAFRSDPNIGYDRRNGKITWVCRKPSGVPVCLRTWVPKLSEKKNAVHNLKGYTVGIVGAELLGNTSRSGETVFLCEGEWDRHATLHLFQELNLPGIVLSTPGAKNFDKSWVEWFKKRKVVVLYDNDLPGREGTVKVYKMLRQVVSSIDFVHWDAGLPDGYDMNDLISSNLENLKATWEFIQGALKDKPTAEVLIEEKEKKVIGRESEQETAELYSIDKLHTTFKKWLLLDNCDLLDIVMGVLWAIHLPGNPLWMLIVAPPSGSKSETIMPISQWWRCHAMTTISSKGLVSGYRGKDDSDPSKLAELDGQKAVITIKDMTVLLQGSQEERDEVFSILRDAYDGKLTKMFGNGVTRSYENLHFGIIAGVTPAIDSIDNTSMGERFLKFRGDRDIDRDDEEERAMRAIQNCGSENEMRKELSNACVGALQRPFKEENVPKPTNDDARFFASLAYITANLRGVAPEDSFSSIQTMCPMVEATPRLATQFVKLAQGLALHYESDSLGDIRIRKLVRRVAMHTPDKITSQIAQAIFHFSSSEGISISYLGSKITSLNRETISKVVRKMCALGFLEKETDPIRNSHNYRFAKHFKSKLITTNLFLDLPKTDSLYRDDIEQTTPGPMVLRRKA